MKLSVSLNSRFKPIDLLFVSSFAHLKLLLKIPPLKYVPSTTALVTAPLGLIVIAVVSQPDNQVPASTPYCFPLTDEIV